MSLEPLGVDAGALRGYGMDLLTAAGDIPAAPAPFAVTGADAISQKISSLLPSIEGPILDGLPQVKAEAQATAERVVSAADTYQRVDEELAGKVRENGFGEPGCEAAAGGGEPGSATGAEGVSGSGAAGSGMGGAGGSGAGGADPMSQMGQMMGVPMQIASQAAQIPMQALGALAAVPQAIVQGMQQVSQLAGGLGGESDAEKDEESSPEEDRAEEPKPEKAAAAERTGAERAPVEPLVTQRDSNVAPVEPAPEKQPAQTRPAQTTRDV